ncbi:MAG: hypothetical protein DI534_04515 [Leifsonia xyli]|nr:MAG: hypothetical protein DI534_04515 [Leifsonia xyli]
MHPTPPAEAPAPTPLVLARELSRIVYDDPAARRAAARGELVRIRRGIYADALEWEALSPDEKYLAVCRGFALSRSPQPVLSHESAAAIWGLPRLGPPPHAVHVSTDSLTSSRSLAGVRSHLEPLAAEDVTVRDGVWVTSLARTVVDLAATAEVVNGMAGLDHVLYVDRLRGPRTGLVRDDLLTVLEGLGPLRGRVRARSRIEFAATGASTIAETGSRVTMAQIGTPPPSLQHPFAGEHGHYETDFFFADEDAVGEVDGKIKYLDPRYRGGRSTEQVVYDEKVREDDLRRLVRTFGRWPMSVGLNRDRLRVRMLELGVPVGLRGPRIQ